MSAAASPSLLEYATPLGRDPWRPILFKPSRRSVLLALLTAASITWLALRHDPWRLFATIPSDYHLKPLFTADNRILAFDTRFGVNLYDPATGQKLRNVLPNLDTGTYRYFVLKNGEQILALPHIDRTALLYDVNSGRVIDRLPNPDGLGSTLVAIAPDAPRIVSSWQTRPSASPRSAYAAGSLRWWDLAQKPRPEPVEIPIAGDILRFSSDSRRLLIRTRNGPLCYRLFDTEKLRLSTPFLFFAVPTPWVTEGLSDHYFWAVVPRPKAPWELHLYDLETINPIRIRNLQGITNPSGVIVDSALSDDADLLATSVDVGVNHMLQVHDTITGKSILDRQTRFSSPTVFFPDSHRLLACDADKGQLAIVDPQRSRPLAILTTPPLDRVVPAPTISPDGQTIVSRGDPHGLTLGIYRPAGWECPESPHGALAFPHTWLTAALLTLLTLSLATDARRARTGAATRPPSSLLTTILLLFALPLTVHFTLEACLGHRTLSPAPLLLLAAIGLMTHSRFWRLATLVLLSGLFPLLIYSAHRVIQLGLKDNYRFQFLDRFHDIPHLVPFLALCGFTALTAWAIYLLARPRPA